MFLWGKALPFQFGISFHARLCRVTAVGQAQMSMKAARGQVRAATTEAGTSYYAHKP